MKRSITDFANPFEALEAFETALGEFTGAKGVVVTDSCTHALELVLRYNRPKVYASIPAHTYLSVPMTLLKLKVDYMLTDEEWKTHYRIGGSTTWDCARYFEKDMFVPNHAEPSTSMCVSFGHGKPLEIGHGGAILTNDKKLYNYCKRAAYDGRDLSISPWADQKEFELGYHYNMRPEDAIIGLNKLASEEINTLATPGYKEYPDLRDITINT